MNDRLKLIIIGCLYLSAFGLYGGGQYLFSQENFLSGAILVGINSIAVLSIGFLFLPIISKDSKSTANIYLLGRVADAALLGAGGFLLWYFQGSEQGIFWNLLGYHTGMIIFGMTGVVFCRWMLAGNRIPTILALAGIGGYTSMVFAMVSERLGYFEISMFLLIPGAFFEIAFAFWVIFKGFKQHSN